MGTPTQLLWIQLVSWINSVPAVIWSGLIGAGTALIGVYFADRNNTKRMELQLKHDAEQKERDRLSILRKDVYLRAPIEAVKALTYLSRLSGRDLATIGEDEGISGFAAASMQIGVISDLATAEAVSEFANALALELLTSLHELQEAQDCRVDVRIREQRLEVVFNEIGRIQAELQQMSESGQIDPSRHGGLNYWLEARMEECSTLREELNLLRDKHLSLLLQHHERLLDRMPALTELSIRVMREVRKEIGLAHELGAYEAKMKGLANDLITKSKEVVQDWTDAKP